jgi:pyruvate-formate lyase-activating enzyme
MPTLIMMKDVAENIKAPFMNFKYASQSVTALHEAGVTVLARTNANTQPRSPKRSRMVGHSIKSSSCW